jgi:hypothetical protein
VVEDEVFFFLDGNKSDVSQDRFLMSHSDDIHEDEENCCVKFVD